MIAFHDVEAIFSVILSISQFIMGNITNLIRTEIIEKGNIESESTRFSNLNNEKFKIKSESPVSLLLRPFIIKDVFKMFQLSFSLHYHPLNPC